MKKLIILSTILIFLSGCDAPYIYKDSTLLITSKYLVQSNPSEYGKYKYTVYLIPSRQLSDIIILYSDSNWNVGDTVNILK